MTKSTRTNTKNLILIVFLILLFGLQSNAQVELLLNNNFDDSTNNWQVWEDGATATFTIDATSALEGINSAHIAITAGGVESWRISFAQSIPAGVSVDDNYKLEYTAKASVEGTLEHKIQDDIKDSWASLYSNTLSLTTEVQNFSETFTVSATASCNFVFSLGAFPTSAKVWIDNVRLTNLSATAGINDVHTNISMVQNYPNPFSSTTTIDFNLLQADNVEVSVYNALGKKVINVVNKEFVAGKNSIELDLTNYATGVYYYTIKAGNYSQTIKMALVK